MSRTTRTYAILPISHQAFREVYKKLEEAGYQHAFHDNKHRLVIDMHGIALQEEPKDDPQTTTPEAAAGLARSNHQEPPVPQGFCQVPTELVSALVAYLPASVVPSHHGTVVQGSGGVVAVAQPTRRKVVQDDHLLQRLWTWAVGLPGYDKELWKTLVHDHWQLILEVEELRKLLEGIGLHSRIEIQ